MRKALVVGINNYSFQPLQACVNDATAIADLLRIDGFGNPNFDVLLEIDPPTKASLKGSIRSLFSGDPDIALLYFSGHGDLDDIGGYIVTPDATQDDVGVSMSEILSMVNNSKAKNRIIILDCCHSGFFGKTYSTAASEIREGVTILTASRDFEPAVEDLIMGHGIFTNLLIDALRGGAADLKGHITPGSVYAYIDQALGSWDQRPVFKTNITRFTSLRSVPPQIPTGTLRKLIAFFPSSDFEFPLNPSFEDTNTTEIKHNVLEPYADPSNVTIFKMLQKLQSVGLVVPVDEEHMYFAAMKSKSCKLTALGHHYWRLVKENRL